MSRAGTYGCTAAKIRTRTGFFLRGSREQRMLQAGSLEEALLLLRDHPRYGFLRDVYRETGEIDLLECVLEAEEMRSVFGVFSSLPPREKNVFSSAVLFYEIRGLKDFIRLWFMKNVVRSSPETIRQRERRLREYDRRTGAEGSVSGDENAVPEGGTALMFRPDRREAENEEGPERVLARMPVYEALWRKSLSFLKEHKSLFFWEALLDRLYFMKMCEGLSFCDSLSRQKIAPFCFWEIDYYNLQLADQCLTLRDFSGDSAEGTERKKPAHALSYSLKGRRLREELTVPSGRFKGADWSRPETRDELRELFTRVYREAPAGKPLYDEDWRVYERKTKEKYFSRFRLGSPFSPALFWGYLRMLREERRKLMRIFSSCRMREDEAGFERGGSRYGHSGGAA